MRKIFLTVLLSFTLVISDFAGGVTPISGFAGCDGLYYPDTGECVAQLAPSDAGGKQQSVFSESNLIGAILSFRNTIF